jgi:hypothetical protein
MSTNTGDERTPGATNGPPPRKLTWIGWVGALVLVVANIIHLAARDYAETWFIAVVVGALSLILLDSWRQAFRMRAWTKQRENDGSSGGRKQ